MPDPSLAPNHRRVLQALIGASSTAGECTTERLAERIGLPVRATRHALRDLQRAEPSLVCEEADAGRGLRFWAATSAAADAMRQ